MQKNELKFCFFGKKVVYLQRNININEGLCQRICMLFTRGANGKLGEKAQ